MVEAEIQSVRIPNKVLLFVGDAVMILLSLTLSTVMLAARDWGLLFRGDTLGRFSFVLLIFTAGLYYGGLYSFSLTAKRDQFLVRHLRAMGVAFLLLALLYRWQPASSLGAKTTCVATAAILIVIATWRLAVGTPRFAQSRMERILVLGTGTVGREVARRVVARPDLDAEIVGFLDDRDLVKGGRESRILGKAADVEAVARHQNIHCVVVSLAERRGRMPVDQLLRLKLAGIKIEDAHTAYERLTGRISLEHLNPSWLILSTGFRNAGFGRVLKYGLDFVLAIVLVILCTPVMLLVAAAILLETGRPILFIQARIGQGGKLFRILKLRSMYTDSLSNTEWTTENDARITRVGSFIRKYRLDELPQLFNVIRGEMSLVGPRPEQPHICDVIAECVPYFVERHSVRPGITGWAQINYQYVGSIDESRTKLEYDLFYLKHMSLWLDMTILFSTVNVVLFGKGAK